MGQKIVFAVQQWTLPLVSNIVEFNTFVLKNWEKTKTLFFVCENDKGKGEAIFKLVQLV